jgi:hypothetical protein
MDNPFGAEGILKKFQEMQERMNKVQAELKDLRVEGTAAGGLVTAIVNGHKELVDLKISPEAVADGDLELLEDLVVAAVASAAESATESAKEKLTEVTGGMLPPGMDLDSLMGRFGS